jgi:hypothetical protein
MVSWQLHLIAWGEARKKLGKRIERLNERRIVLPIADGLAAAHQKRISQGKAADKIAYVLKSPKKKLIGFSSGDRSPPMERSYPRSSRKRAVSVLGSGWPCSD